MGKELSIEYNINKCIECESIYHYKTNNNLCKDCSNKLFKIEKKCSQCKKLYIDWQSITPTLSRQPLCNNCII